MVDSLVILDSLESCFDRSKEENADCIRVTLEDVVSTAAYDDAVAFFAELLDIFVLLNLNLIARRRLLSFDSCNQIRK